MPSMYFANNNVISQNLVCSISFIEIFILSSLGPVFFNLWVVLASLNSWALVKGLVYKGLSINA